MAQRFGWLGVIACAVVLTVACTGGSSDDEDNGGSGGGGGGDSTVAVSLTGTFTVEPSVATAEAGEISFEVTNNGQFPHELAVVTTDLAPDALPMNGAVVDETQIEILGRTAQLNPGATETITLDLVPGTYILLSNVSGHYQAGMYTTFTVE